MLKILSKDEYEQLPITLKVHYAKSGGAYVPQVEGMVGFAELEEAKSKLAEFRDNNIALLKKGNVERKLFEVALEKGIRAEVLPDYLQRGHAIFTEVDGTILAFDDKDRLLYSKDGVNPLGLNEWLRSLPRVFFEPSVGGGAIGGQTGR
jgi:hypothetical protein